ncbi:DUF1415 family protein [Aliiglaciecola lipolytica]|uniref:DUF1415 domain-containing protein n=1 Tax=Aliiglaciecola lipolytica E3 TaxID=1127673 RepID=K6YCP0_9ALTE|nr:DUF1415 domain-containing protein [Aliiglaciecola lipolytica]GAC14388.1 hypothetical protein GLIP_1755 [Aliiglaciecola lipolytica E3]
MLSLLQAEIEHLNQHSKTETTLIVLTNGFNHFFDYLDLVDVAQQWLEENDYVGIYQIASFHPEYVFEGESIDSAANYTNRSPHPTLHLLREQSLERAIKSYKHPEQIPENNIDKAHSMGKAELKVLLASCMKI